MIGQYDKELKALGENIQVNPTDTPDPSKPDPDYALILRVVDQFVNYFKGSLDGTVDQGGKEVKGGACIEEKFNEKYWNDLETIIPLDNVSDLETWTEIRNSWVYAVKTTFAGKITTFAFREQSVK